MMDEFMPSEIARLILGYLIDDGCTKSWNTFLEESPSLQEYNLLYKKGRVYSTNVDGKSLLEILKEYRALKSEKNCLSAINSAAKVNSCESTNNYHSKEDKSIIHVDKLNSKSNAIVRDMPQTDLFLNISDVYSLNNAGDKIPSFSNEQHLDDALIKTPDKNINDSSKNEIVNISSNKKSLIKIKVSSSEIEDSNLQVNSSDTNSGCKSEVEPCDTTDQLLHDNKSDNDSDNKKCDSNLNQTDTVLLTGPAKDVPTCGYPSSDIQKVTANLVEASNSIELKNSCKLKIQDGNHPDKELEKNQAAPNNLIRNPFSTQVNINSDNVNQMNDIVTLNSSNNQFGVTVAPNNYQLTTINGLPISTVPTYILSNVAGEFLIQNTAAPCGTILMNAPYNGVCLPLPAPSVNNIQNPEFKAIDSTKVYENALAMAISSASKSVTLSEEPCIKSNTIGENSKNNCNKKNAVKQKLDDKNKSKLSSTGKRYYPKRTPKRKLIHLFSSAPEKNIKIENASEISTPRLVSSAPEKNIKIENASEISTPRLFSSAPEKNIKIENALEISTSAKFGHETSLKLLSLIPGESEGRDDYVNSPELLRKSSSSKGACLNSKSIIPNKNEAKNSDKYESQKVNKGRKDTKKSEDIGDRICDKKMVPQKQNYSVSNNDKVDKSKKQRNQSCVISNKKQIFGKSNSIETNNEMQSNNKRNKSKIVSRKLVFNIESKNLASDDDICNLELDTITQTINSVALSGTKQCTQLSLSGEESNNTFSERKTSQKFEKSNAVKQSSKQKKIKSNLQKLLKNSEREKEITNLSEKEDSKINLKNPNRKMKLKTYSKLVSLVQVKESDNVSLVADSAAEIRDNITRSPLHPNKHCSIKEENFCDTMHSFSNLESSKSQDSILETLFDSATSLLDNENTSTTATQSLFSLTQTKNASEDLSTNINCEINAGKKRKLYENFKCTETFEENNINDQFFACSSPLTAKKRCVLASSLNSGKYYNFLLKSSINDISENNLGNAYDDKNNFHEESYPKNILNENTPEKNTIACKIAANCKLNNVPYVLLTKLPALDIVNKKIKLECIKEGKVLNYSNEFADNCDQTMEATQKETMGTQENPTTFPSTNDLVMSHTTQSDIDNIVDFKCSKDTVKADMDRSDENGSELTLAMASIKTELVESSNSGHSPETEDTVTYEFPTKWALVQSAIEKYGCDYILQKVEEARKDDSS